MQKDVLGTVLKFYTAASSCVRLNTQFALPLQLVTDSLAFGKSIFLRGVKIHTDWANSNVRAKKKNLKNTLFFRKKQFLPPNFIITSCLHERLGLHPKMYKYFLMMRRSSGKFGGD